MAKRTVDPAELVVALRHVFDGQVEAREGRPLGDTVALARQTAMLKAWKALGEARGTVVYQTTVESWRAETGRCQGCGRAQSACDCLHKTRVA
jgi:hypothetical protein